MDLLFDRFVTLDSFSALEFETFMNFAYKVADEANPMAKLGILVLVDKPALTWFVRGLSSLTEKMRQDLTIAFTNHHRSLPAQYQSAPPRLLATFM
jgi:hypothetical protein